MRATTTGIHSTNDVDLTRAKCTCVLNLWGWVVCGTCKLAGCPETGYTAHARTRDQMPMGTCIRSHSTLALQAHPRPPPPLLVSRGHNHSRCCHVAALDESWVPAAGGRWQETQDSRIACVHPAVTGTVDSSVVRACHTTSSRPRGCMRFEDASAAGGTGRHWMSQLGYRPCRTVWLHAALVTHTDTEWWQLLRSTTPH